MSNPSPSTQSMLLALLMDRISTLETQIRHCSPSPAAMQGTHAAENAGFPGINPDRSQGTHAAENAGFPGINPDRSQGSTPTPVLRRTLPAVEEDEDATGHTSLMGIGNSEQVAILARVSTAEQKSSSRDSLANQIEACMEQLRKMGCKNPHLISQLDESASQDGKQQEEFFATVSRFAKTPVVMVRTVSRFSRNLAIGMQRLNAIEKAGGRIIFGVAEQSDLVWYDTSNQLGRVKFESQLQFAQQWTQEMSATARDNAKRKRQAKTAPPKSNKKSKAQPSAPAPEPSIRQKQTDIINQALNKNNRDSFELRRIIDWIRMARRGGSASHILGHFKDLINWNVWKHHPKCTEWRINPWTFTNDAAADPQKALHGELSLEWIAVNLREWKVRVPPIRGIANIRAGWTSDLVELMHNADQTNELQTLMQRL